MYHKKAQYNSQKREPCIFKPVKKAKYNSQKREPGTFIPYIALEGLFNQTNVTIR